MDKERRILHSEFKVEDRAAGTDAVRIRGYAAMFETTSENLGGFVETIARGAFDDVLGDDVRAFFNHEESLILGRTEAGTLELDVDDRGLAYTVTLPDTTYARDLVESMRRGDVTQSSFSFSVARGGAKWEIPEGDSDEPAVRTVTKIARLWDVAPVSIPAYPDTTAAARALDVERALARHDPRLDPAHRRKQLRLLEIGASRPTRPRAA